MVEDTVACADAATGLTGLVSVLGREVVSQKQRRLTSVSGTEK